MHSFHLRSTVSLAAILLALSSHETFERVSLTKYRGRVEIEIQSRGAMTPSFLVVAIFPVVLCILVPCRVLEPCFAPKFPAFSRVNCFLFYFSPLFFFFFFLVQSRSFSVSEPSFKQDRQPLEFSTTFSCGLPPPSSTYHALHERFRLFANPP